MATEAWAQALLEERDALVAQLAASQAATPRARAELHAALAEVLKDLGYNHGHAAGLEGAQTHARLATELVPEEPLYWLLRGRRELEPRAQIACLTEALRLSGGSPAAYKERGYVFKTLGYYVAAREDFLRATGAAEGHGDPADEAAALAVGLASVDVAAHGLPGHADALAAELGRLTPPPPAKAVPGLRVLAVLAALGLLMGLLWMLRR